MHASSSILSRARTGLLPQQASLLHAVTTMVPRHTSQGQPSRAQPAVLLAARFLTPSSSIVQPLMPATATAHAGASSSRGTKRARPIASKSDDLKASSGSDTAGSDGESPCANNTSRRRSGRERSSVERYVPTSAVGKRIPQSRQPARFHSNPLCWAQTRDEHDVHVYLAGPEFAAAMLIARACLLSCAQSRPRTSGNGSSSG